MVQRQVISIYINVITSADETGGGGGVRRSGRGPGARSPNSLYITYYCLLLMLSCICFAFLGNVTCRLYKVTISDQATETQNFRVTVNSFSRCTLAQWPKNVFSSGLKLALGIPLDKCILRLINTELQIHGTCNTLRVPILHLKIHFVFRNKHTIKTNLLKLCRKVIASPSVIHKTYRNILCEQDVEFLNVQFGGV